MTPQERIRAQARHLRVDRLGQLNAITAEPTETCIAKAVYLVGADLLEFGADLLDAVYALNEAVEKAVQ